MSTVDPVSPVEDDVDRLIAAWRRERPDLDVAPLAVLSRVTRLARHLDRERRAAFGSRDLEGWEFDVLAALRRAGPPYRLSPGRLVAETLVTSGTMTNRVDRLEARGFVRREPDENDGRGVQVYLSTAGRRQVDGALADLLDNERRLLASLPDDRRDELAGLLRTLVATFDNA